MVLVVLGLRGFSGCGIFFFFFLAKTGKRPSKPEQVGHPTWDIGKNAASRVFQDTGRT